VEECGGRVCGGVSVIAVRYQYDCPPSPSLSYPPHTPSLLISLPPHLQGRTVFQ
jgi:hypothetical protein